MIQDERTTEELRQAVAELRKQNAEARAQAKELNKSATESQSKSAKVVEKLGSDIKKSTSKGISSIGKKASKTIENVPTLAMSKLDPSTQLVFNKIGESVKSSFGYIKSFGSVISDKDSKSDEDRDETKEKIEKSTEENTESLSTLNDSVKHGFGRLLAFMQGQSLEEYEKQREEAIERKQLLSEIENLSKASAVTKGDDEEEGGPINRMFMMISAKLGPILMKVLTPLAVGIGVIVGIITGYAKELKLIGKAISGVSKLFAKVFSVKGMSGTFTGIIDTFKEVVKRIKGAFDSFSKFVGKLIKPISEAVKKAQKTAGFFSNILGGLGKIGSIVSKVAGVVSKLFVPLRILFVLFETIMGTIKGYAEGGILGAIQGAISGFFKALVGAPLDLIKSMISWILDKFGFENAAEALESFSFSDIIVDIVKAPFKLFENLRDWISEKVSGLVSKFASFIPGPIKTLLGLNDSDEEGGGEESQGVASQAIKDLGGMALDAAGDVGGAISDTVNSIGNAISGFFGGGDDDEDAETAAGNVAAGRRAARDRLREDVATQEGGGSTAAAFDNLQAERDQLEMEGSRRDRRGRGGDVYAPTNVNSSSTTQVIKPLPAVSRRPSSAQDLFYNVAP